MIAYAGAFVLAAATAPSMPSAAPPSLGGVAIGDPIVHVVSRLGLPQTLDATADGTVWQWSSRDGLDLEVLTRDDLAVARVLVARVGIAGSAATGQPAEFPVLGDSMDAAETAIDGVGGDPVELSAAEDAWIVRGAVAVARASAGGVVTSLMLEDRRMALASALLWPSPRRVAYRPPTLVSTFIPPHLPQDSGECILRVAIGADGHVSDVTVVVSSRSPEVDAWSVDSMRRSTFAPATCDGVACAGVYLDVGGITR